MSLEPISILKIIISFISQIWEIIKLWWWLPLPFILWRQFTFFWRWWRVDLFLAKQKMIILEISMPKDVLKPMRAMEVAMDSLHKILYKPPDWWEKWIEGQVQLSYSFDIVSIGGEPHFYIRIPYETRDPVESAIYAQYPEAEISLVDDYTKNVPQDMPNKDWDFWGSDYGLLKEDYYPIKTYKKFETESEGLEEKRIDPLANLLESMAKIKPGEQLWIQIMAEPITNKEFPWVAKGEELKDKLARRPAKAGPQKPIIMEAADVLITGKVPGETEEKKEEIIPPEMKLTPGEREIIAGVEEKISKPGFKTNIRFIYLGKRDVFFKSNFRLAFSFFGAYTTENLNGFKPLGKTLSKIHKSWFLPLNLIRKRRLYLRQRKIFRMYKERLDFFWPRSNLSTAFILNTEELASLFHFPSRRVASAPFVPRIEAKKGEAPSGLPTE